MAGHGALQRTGFTLVEVPAVGPGAPGSELSAVSLPKRHSAFSIVELLVVIGIVTVLIGILLPALTKAREASRRTVCSSNVRQLCAAQIMYADDHKGVFVDASGIGQSYPYYIDPNIMSMLLTNYQLQRVSFYCPSNLDWDSDGNWFNSSGDYVIGYCFIGGQVRLSQKTQTVLTYYYGFEEVPAGSLVCPRKLDDYNAFYPVLVTDLTRSYASVLNRSGGANHIVGTDANGCLPVGTGGSNVGYMDGHVEWHTQNEMGQAHSNPANLRQFYFYDPSGPICRIYW